MGQTKTVRFTIHGMHCTSCAMNIDLDLEEVPGIISVSTSYAKQECVVEFEPTSINEAKICHIIENSGYTAFID